MSGALVVVSDRAADQIVLRVIDQNIDGDDTQEYTLPAGFGPCLYLESWIVVESIATMLTDFQYNGPIMQIGTSTAFENSDFCGRDRWTRHGAARLMAHLRADQPAMWKTNESAFLQYAEIDTNGAPTADLYLWIRVRRLVS